MFRTSGVGRDERQVNLALLRGRQLDLRAFGSFFEPLQRHAVVAQVNTLIPFELFDQPIHDAEVKVVSAQVRVPIGGLYLKDALTDLQD